MAACPQWHQSCVKNPLCALLSLLIYHFCLSATPPRLPLCVPLLSISRSVCLSAEMSPSFVTRLGSDWTVHPFSVWLTRLSRWRHPFIPAVQQSAPHCNPSLHPKHRCEGPGYFSGVHVHTVLVYTQTKKKAYWAYTTAACAHILIFERTHTARTLATSFCGLWAHVQFLISIFFFIWIHFSKSHKTCKLYQQILPHKVMITHSDRSSCMSLNYLHWGKLDKVWNNLWQRTKPPTFLY